MKLGTTNYFVKIDRNGNIYFAEGSSKYTLVTDPNMMFVLKQTQRICKSHAYTDAEKTRLVERNLRSIGIDTSAIANTTANQQNDTPVQAIDVVKLESVMKRLIDFFSEFGFEPNFRFVNTFAYACNESKTAARKYVNNYFALTDNQYASSIAEKVKSMEFEQILSDMASFTPTHRVNTRFRLYYGSAGTGKTTRGEKDANSNTITCHSAMLPNDLMEDFKFVDGKATFVPSALQIAMIEGKPIMLDEINLLPFESLRFLQTILDGKSSFIYKGNIINIADGFKIIGTMNLTVNGAVYALPDPLVDRAEYLEKFVLTAADLVHAII